MPKHIYRCPLRWADMDAYGHVNNVVFLRYLEEARVDLLFRDSPQDGGEKSFASGVVVARHEVDYLRPLGYRREPVTVETWVTRVNTASFTVAYEVRDGDTVYARASTVLVPYVLTEGRPRRLTPDERSFLRNYLVSDTADAPPEGDRADGTGGADRDGGGAAAGRPAGGDTAAPHGEAAPAGGTGPVPQGGAEGDGTSGEAAA